MEADYTSVRVFTENFSVCSSHVARLCIACINILFECHSCVARMIHARHPHVARTSAHATYVSPVCHVHVSRMSHRLRVAHMACARPVHVARISRARHPHVACTSPACRACMRPCSFRSTIILWFPFDPPFRTVSHRDRKPEFRSAGCGAYNNKP